MGFWRRNWEKISADTVSGLSVRVMAGIIFLVEGHARWTLRLLAEEMVELNHFSSISHECIRQVLKKTNCVPGASSSGVSPQRLRRHS